MIPVDTEAQIESLLKAGTCSKAIASRLDVSPETVYAMATGARAMDASRQRAKNRHILTDPDLGLTWRKFPASKNVHCPRCRAHVIALAFVPSAGEKLCRACALRQLNISRKSS